MKNRIFKEWELSLVGLLIILVALYSFLVPKLIGNAELVVLLTIGLGALGLKKSDIFPTKND